MNDNSQYKKIIKQLEKRFSEIENLTNELFFTIDKMRIAFSDKNLMQIYEMNFNDKVEELKEEYDLVLTICNVYNFNE